MQVRFRQIRPASGGYLAIQRQRSQPLQVVCRLAGALFSRDGGSCRRLVVHNGGRRLVPADDAVHCGLRGEGGHSVGARAQCAHSGCQKPEAMGEAGTRGTGHPGPQHVQVHRQQASDATHAAAQVTMMVHKSRGLHGAAQQGSPPAVNSGYSCSQPLRLRISCTSWLVSTPCSFWPCSSVACGDKKVKGGWGWGEQLSL